MEITLELVLLLFATAVVAGLIDTLAGGGGLITIPALMLSGMPPVMALGTNKLQGSVGTGTATFFLLRQGRLKWRLVKKLVVPAFLGAMAGSMAVLFIDQSRLSLIVPMVLCCILVFFLLYQPGRTQVQRPRLSATPYINGAIPTIGFYDGMFGPGTGSFFALAGMLLRGSQLVRATATAKPLNFATNLASLLVFAASGNIVLKIGIAMLLGQMLGAWLGTRFLYRMKPHTLRLLVIFMSAAMLLKYLHAEGYLPLQ